MSTVYHAPSLESLCASLRDAGYQPSEMSWGCGAQIGAVRVQIECERSGRHGTGFFRFIAAWSDSNYHSHRKWIKFKALDETNNPKGWQSAYEFDRPMPVELWDRFFPRLKEAIQQATAEEERKKENDRARVIAEEKYARRSEWLEMNAPRFSSDGNGSLRFGVYDDFEAMQDRIKAAHDILFPPPPSLARERAGARRTI